MYPCPNPRDAFFGRRINAVRLHHVANEDQGEEIKYVDVTSLYPWVNKAQQYPNGHPIIITNPENQEIHVYFIICVIPSCLSYIMVNWLYLYAEPALKRRPRNS